MHGGHELARGPCHTASARQLGRNALKCHDSVVCAQTPLAGPDAVLDCLSRYADRVAVSNERMLSKDAAGMQLRVRADNQGGKRVIPLDGPECMG